LVKRERMGELVMVLGKKEGEMQWECDVIIWSIESIHCSVAVTRYISRIQIV
jgi:hypothetical protein